MEMQKILIIFLLFTLSSCVIINKPNCHTYSQASMRHKMKSPNLKKRGGTHKMLPTYMRDRD